jgi:hypothetical protein
METRGFGVETYQSAIACSPPGGNRDAELGSVTHAASRLDQGSGMNLLAQILHLLLSPAVQAFQRLWVPSSCGEFLLPNVVW